MRTVLISAILTLCVMSLFHGQQGFAQGTKPDAHPPSTPSTTPRVPSVSYLTSSLNLETTNVGRNFRGHDITAVLQAIAKSAALKGKSEFESTSAYDTRRGTFAKLPLFGSLMPDGSFGFVVGEEPGSIPTFEYDADSQQMGVTIKGITEQFILDPGEPSLDTIFVRSILSGKDSYVGGNAFGAKVKVERTFLKEYGIAFDPLNWLFRTSPKYDLQTTYSIPMTPNEARAFKSDAKLLLVCTLIEPWTHETSAGHRATVSEPYEIISTKLYLQAVPLQLWIFNSRTGEVIRKIVEEPTKQ